MVANREYIENLIYDFYNELDPSGANTDKMKAYFQSMSDTEFEKFFKQFLKDDSENFTLDIVEYEHDLKFEHCEAAAKFLGIELFEYIYMPHLTMDKSRVVVSKEKCLVGYLNVKRTQQVLQKKNGLTISNEKKSMITGQVVAKDKNARDSDIEASMLVALGADKILKELHGPRADDNVMKQQMFNSIANKGFVMLDELEDVSTNKTTLNTVNAYLLSMHIRSDLVSDSYILPKVSEEVVDLLK